MKCGKSKHKLDVATRLQFPAVMSLSYYILTYLSISSCFVDDADELFDLWNGRSREVLHRDEGPFQFRKCVVRRKLVGGEGDEVVDALRDQEPELKQEFKFWLIDCLRLWF